MARTARRPMARGEITVAQTLAFSGVIGGIGMWVLYTFVNPLTMWLTFATFVGYAVIYTIVLKPATPQNIVIGGLSGAMPPALGWAAIANEVPMQAWLLVLIIFIWTPPHFWALALYRRDDYVKVGPADAAGHARPGIHPVSCAAVHDRAGGDHLAAVRGRHERLACIWPARWCWTRFSSGTRGRSIAITATGSRARPSPTRSSTCPCCLPPCWWITI